MGTPPNNWSNQTSARQSVFNASIEELSNLRENIEISKRNKQILKNWKNTIEEFNKKLKIKADEQRAKIKSIFQEITDIIFEREDNLLKKIGDIVESKEDFLKHIKL